MKNIFKFAWRETTTTAEGDIVFNAVVTDPRGRIVLRLRFIDIGGDFVKSFLAGSLSEAETYDRP